MINTLTISVPTAARLAGVSAPTIHKWARELGIGRISEASHDGGRAKIRIDPYALWLVTVGDFEELANYRAGTGNSVRKDSVLDAIGLGHGDVAFADTPMSGERKRPLLIEHSRIFVSASTRRAILTEAERRGVPPLQVLLDHYEQREASDGHD